MNFRIISLPPFRAVTSGVDKIGDFAEDGILCRFDRFFSSIVLKPDERFMPRDFLYYDDENGGMVWLWALTQNNESGNYETIEFEGGLYITFAFQDGDNDAHDRLHKEVYEYIETSDILELDIRPNHYSMGHIITPQVVIDAQGWGQMEVFVPIKIKDTAIKTETTSR